MFMACPLTSAAYNVILFDISNDKKLIKSYSSSVCNKTVKGPSQNVCCAYFAFVRSATTIGCLPFKKSFRTAGHVVQNERLLSDVCSNACREVLVARRRPQYPTTGGNNYRQILSASAIIVLSLTRETAVAGCHVHRGILCLTASTHTHTHVNYRHFVASYCTSTATSCAEDNTLVACTLFLSRIWCAIRTTGRRTRPVYSCRSRALRNNIIRT